MTQLRSTAYLGPQVRLQQMRPPWKTLGPKCEFHFSTSVFAPPPCLSHSLFLSFFKILLSVLPSLCLSLYHFLFPSLYKSPNKNVSWRAAAWICSTLLCVMRELFKKYILLDLVLLMSCTTTMLIYVRANVLLSGWQNCQNSMLSYLSSMWTQKNVKKLLLSSNTFEPISHLTLALGFCCHFWEPGYFREWHTEKVNNVFKSWKHMRTPGTRRKKQAVTVGERGTGCLHKAGSHLHPNKAAPKKKKRKKDDKIDRWNWRKIKMFMVLSPSGSYLWLQMWFISLISLPFPPHSSPSP